MTTATLVYTGQLVVTSCWCGIGVAIPSSLYKEAQANHRKAVFCPIGHEFVFGGESEADKFKRLYAEAQDRAVVARAEADQAEASRRAWKGQATRARNRVLAGSCPFCGQHLRDVQRHVERMHGDEASADPNLEPEG